MVELGYLAKTYYFGRLYLNDDDRSLLDVALRDFSSLSHKQKVCLLSLSV
jgi:hypothetical protein